jgi:Protein of unknown function (DUF2934)
MSSDFVRQQTQNSSHDEIAVRAYYLWEERGRPIGSPAEDWSRAENEISGAAAAQEEWVRLRNEEVRAHHRHETNSLPPFTDFSGQL